jgi:hypothetical protein
LEFLIEGGVVDRWTGYHEGLETAANLLPRSHELSPGEAPTLGHEIIFLIDSPLFGKPGVKQAKP